MKIPKILHLYIIYIIIDPFYKQKRINETSFTLYIFIERNFILRIYWRNLSVLP